MSPRHWAGSLTLLCSVLSVQQGFAQAEAPPPAAPAQDAEPSSSDAASSPDAAPSSASETPVEVPSEEEIARAEASAEALMTKKEEYTELASLDVPEGPEYPQQCRASGEIRDSLGLGELPAPSAEQLRALAILQSEERAYSADARAYQRQLTTIVRHHYEERRLRMLAAINKEIEYERGELKEARLEAMERLRQFIARYSGPHADPEATPDAMLRLAALYEEQVREDNSADYREALRPAIALYRRIAVEFPGYSQLATALYHLGHAYLDSTRFDEAQVPWRALVCANKYQVQPTPGTEDGVVLSALVQDHDAKFWGEWTLKHLVPVDQDPRWSVFDEYDQSKEELSFKDPYAGCQPLQQEVAPGADPPYVAEIWWRLGEYHFDAIDPKAGPYFLNRAASAYAESVHYQRPPLYGVVLYKQAWTLFRQHRYESAVRRFIDLLEYADSEQERTGDPGTDFRNEAYLYAATSLTYEDFTGPPSQDPEVPRSDVLDLEMDPVRAEQRMAIAIERVQDPELIPQDRSWTSGIFKALAREYLDLHQHNNAIAMLELTLGRYMDDRDAPRLVSELAGLYTERAAFMRGTEEGGQAALKALEWRGKFMHFVGDTRWTRLHENEPEALQEAAELAREQLGEAAKTYTIYGRTYEARGDAAASALEQIYGSLSGPARPGSQAARGIERFEEELKLNYDAAIAQYKNAGPAWAAYIAYDPHDPEVYESRYWLAHAYYSVTRLEALSGQAPAAEQVTTARERLLEAADASDNPTRKREAAGYVVALEEALLSYEDKLTRETGRPGGFLRRAEPTFVGEGESKTVVQDSVPEGVLAAVCARDQYASRIPLDEDLDHDSERLPGVKTSVYYAWTAANYFYVYGQFAEARRRYLPLYQRYCGQNRVGYEAWATLLQIADYTADAEETRRLVESKSCAFDDETRLAEAHENLRGAARLKSAYREARRFFEMAERMDAGVERERMYRLAAAAFKVAVATAPEHPDAPKAVINAAYAYRQVGEYDRAIELNRRFIAEFASAEKLAALQASDPAGFETRRADLRKAYLSLAGSYLEFFDFRGAAEIYDSMSRDKYLAEGAAADARDWADRSLRLYAALGEEEEVLRLRRHLGRQGADAATMARADFLRVQILYQRFNPRAAWEGANARAGVAARQAMKDYYQQNKNYPSAKKYVVRAAYLAAKTYEIEGSSFVAMWRQNTLAAYKRCPDCQAEGQVAGYEGELAAEVAFAIINAKITSDFPVENGARVYKGVAMEVAKSFREDREEVDKLVERLLGAVDPYGSLRWAAVARARAGGLYFAIRRGLYDAQPKLFTDKQEELLRRAEAGDNDADQIKASEVRRTVRFAWLNFRRSQFSGTPASEGKPASVGIDSWVVRFNAFAVNSAAKHNLVHPLLTQAARDMATLTEIVKLEATLNGVEDDLMAVYVNAVPGIAYSPDMYLKTRPGIIEDPEADPAQAAPRVPEALP